MNGTIMFKDSTVPSNMVTGLSM